jgi:hypothetical protein
MGRPHAAVLVRRAISVQLATIAWGQPRLLQSTRTGRSAAHSAYAPMPGDDEHQGDEGLENSPADPGAAAPAVSTPHCLRGTRQDVPCTSAGEPRTPRLSD